LLCQKDWWVFCSSEIFETNNVPLLLYHVLKTPELKLSFGEGVEKLRKRPNTIGQIITPQGQLPSQRQIQKDHK